ncbi:MAG: lamin tail domain-containing protein, partial [Candidatus Eisenbacteria bacterium]|nr:lamin tail domain-containing protein [Candidatus Eisenbacteria bacterium]
GDASGNTNPLDVTMDADKSITATFAIDQHTLAVATVGSGSVAKAPDQPSYAYGSNVQLTATPATGWHFTGWSGDASGSTNPLDVTMDADKSITATFAKNSVVVSQVYGGGGNSGATLTNDFIELFNHGPDPIDVTGWTVQYGSATGSTWSTTVLSGVIPAGRYYLVQESAGAGGSVALPTPDATGSIAMSATSGKVALVNNSTALTGSCPAGPEIEDLIGYGAANCSETSPAGGLGNTTAAHRNSNGCDDTDNNSLDVSSSGPTPRNSSSPANDCLFALTVASDPPASGSVGKSPDQPGYANGAVVQLTATPVSGWHFDHWSGGATGSANPLSLVMNADLAVTAHFVANALSGEVVISQVYGGGGNGGATYKNDFVELFNRGNVTVDLTGWSIQYAAQDGVTWATTTLVGTVQPGGYYLVQEAQGPGGSSDLPAPDGIGVINMGSSDGKVALCSDNVVLSGACPGSAAIVDFVGYGPATCAETAPAPATDNLSASHRNHDGCDETNDNSADFSTAAPTPRNTASPIHVCDIWLGAGPQAVTDFSLSPPAPNPTRGASRIAFALPAPSRVRLSVMDLQGRVLANLVDGVLPAGRHEVVWNGVADGGPAPPGLYFVRFEAPGHRFARNVVLMR